MALHHPVALDVTGNHFKCHCRHEFRLAIQLFRWFKTSDVTIISQDNLLCAGPTLVAVLLLLFLVQFYLNFLRIKTFKVKLLD